MKELAILIPNLFARKNDAWKLYSKHKIKFIKGLKIVDTQKNYEWLSIYMLRSCY